MITMMIGERERERGGSEEVVSTVNSFHARIRLMLRSLFLRNGDSFDIWIVDDDNAYHHHPTWVDCVALLFHSHGQISLYHVRRFEFRRSWRILQRVKASEMKYMGIGFELDYLLSHLGVQLT